MKGLILRIFLQYFVQGSRFRIIPKYDILERLLLIARYNTKTSDKNTKFFNLFALEISSNVSHKLLNQSVVNFVQTVA